MCSGPENGGPVVDDGMDVGISSLVEICLRKISREEWWCRCRNRKI